MEIFHGFRCVLGRWRGVPGNFMGDAWNFWGDKSRFLRGFKYDFKVFHDALEAFQRVSEMSKEIGGFRGSRTVSGGIRGFQGRLMEFPGRLRRF